MDWIRCARTLPLALALLAACATAAPTATPLTPALSPAGGEGEKPSTATATPTATANEGLIRPDDILRDATWLADPARTGRGVGTPGNAAAAEWIAARMKELALAPGAPEGGYLQAFQAPVGAKLQGENALFVGGRALALGTDFLPFTFSDTGVAEGELVWAGYGISAPDLGHDDYAGLDVNGKVVVVAAHFPRESDPASPFRDPQRFQLGEWRYKAMNARDHGAAGLLAVRDDWNHPGPDALEPWRGQVSSQAGIVAARAALEALRQAGVDAAALAAPTQADGKPRSKPLGVRTRLAAGLVQESARTANVVGFLAGSDPAAGCVVLGAHYDHLGYGGETSLAPGRHEVHPGADDNASGVAALLAVARELAAGPPPRRNVAFAAFSGEELGLLGSSAFVKRPPPGCAPEAIQLMVNLGTSGPTGGREAPTRAPPRLTAAARAETARRRRSRHPASHRLRRRRLWPLRSHELLRRRRAGGLLLHRRPRRLPPAERHRGQARRQRLSEVARLAAGRLVPRRCRSAGRFRVVRTAPPPGARPRRARQNRRAATAALPAGRSRTSRSARSPACSSPR